MGKKPNIEYLYDNIKLRKETGARIKEERKRKGETQLEFAMHLDMAKETYIKLEYGGSGTELKLEYLYRIAKYCKCDIGYLLGDIPERTYKATDICKETNMQGKTAEALINANEEQRRFIESVIQMCLCEKEGIFYSLMKNYIDEEKQRKIETDKWFSLINSIVTKYQKEFPEFMQPDNIKGVRTFELTFPDILQLIYNDLFTAFYLETKPDNEEDENAVTSARAQAMKKVNEVQKETNNFYLQYYLNKAYSRINAIDLQRELSIYLNEVEKHGKE